jgi:(1->4)-alpha-D-glucan 1-alpha-D-glucosylmutase
MLYQTLVAAWPIGLGPDDQAGIESFSERVGAWQTKSVREAKLLSEWAAPNETYEAALQEFLRGVLDSTRPVLQEIIQFAERLNLPGAVNGLAQTILRLTGPGVPDLYQGTEFWDQSLVDPDNRRPVDYAAREAALSEHSDIPGLLRSWQSGFVKQAVIASVLNFRKENADLFEAGDYQKLEADGEASQNVLAFTRRIHGKTILVATTRLAAKLCGDMPLAKTEFWQDTKLELPAGEMTNILTGDVFTGKNIFVSDLFAKLPVALLASV